MDDKYGDLLKHLLDTTPHSQEHARAIGHIAQLLMAACSCDEDSEREHCARAAGRREGGVYELVRLQRAAARIEGYEMGYEDGRAEALGSNALAPEHG